MATQRIGILYPVRTKITIQAVTKALTNFYYAPHTADLEPTELHVHPDEVDNIPEIDGYQIIGDERVARGHIRVTTTPMEVADL